MLYYIISVFEIKLNVEVKFDWFPEEHFNFIFCFGYK